MGVLLLSGVDRSSKDKYIHHTCGHDRNSEFVQCPKHHGTEEKCASGTLKREEEKNSPHKCRVCLTSDSGKNFLLIETGLVQHIPDKLKELNYLIIEV